MHQAKERSRDPVRLLRRYYWAVIRHIAIHSLPATPSKIAEQELHRHFKGMILGYEDAFDEDGMMKLEPISTADLDAEELSCYIERVIEAAIDANIPFPDHPEQLLDVKPKIITIELPAPKARTRSVTTPTQLIPFQTDV